MNHGKTVQMICCLMLGLVLLQGLSHPAVASSYVPETNDSPMDWNGIHVLDLKTAQQIAMADNPSIHATEVRVMQAKFLIPMALSLASGVLFATVLTLVLVPSLLTIVSDFRLLIYRFRYGIWPERLAVEPARNRHVDPLKEE